jgi:hypothetical protein
MIVLILGRFSVHAFRLSGLTALVLNATSGPRLPILLLDDSSNAAATVDIDLDQRQHLVKYWALTLSKLKGKALLERIAHRLASAMRG